MATTLAVRQQAVRNPLAVRAERCRRSLFLFMQTFWEEVSTEEPVWNWHIPYLCQRLTEVAFRVARQEQRRDIVINVPPGTTKSITCSVMFPAWCWTRWPWMKFIVGSYSSALSLDHAELARDLIRSDRFHRMFPYLRIRRDKDTKSNFKLIYLDDKGKWRMGGNRFSTSVGGTATGFHGHILIVDDPLNPREALSENKLAAANHWMEHTLSTRKVNKATTSTILIMQRLHEDDPSGHLLAKKKETTDHVCLPGEIRDYAKFVRPVELMANYKDDLLDEKRLTWDVLRDLETDLGQYGYAGQIGQNPVPPGGGMFKVERLTYADMMPAQKEILQTVRYWDKAASEGKGTYTVGTKMSRLRSGKFVVEDVRRGRWSTEVREQIIRDTAEADGHSVTVWQEQEPGSGGKESAESTVRNLAGFVIYTDKVTGDKIRRADPYSVQVNAGNVILLRGDWNEGFVNEHRFFPFGRFKDQVDSAAGACAKLSEKRFVKNLLE